jgi:hypothetical protein
MERTPGVRLTADLHHTGIEQSSASHAGEHDEIAASVADRDNAGFAALSISCRIASNARLASA